MLNIGTSTLLLFGVIAISLAMGLRGSDEQSVKNYLQKDQKIASVEGILQVIASPSAIITKSEKPKQIKASPNPTPIINVSNLSGIDVLNAYRLSYGVNALVWDTRLADYAKKRLDEYIKSGKSDNHKGFYDYVNSGGFKTLGFSQLGENSSWGETNIKKLITEVYASSSTHNQNQLDSKWSHVGIAIGSGFSNFVFGGN